MRKAALLGFILALAACSGQPERESDSESESGGKGEEATLPAILPMPVLAAGALAGRDAAPPRNGAEALLTRNTWPRLEGEAPSGPYAPRDECGEADGAYKFRRKLAEAVLARDADALLALASPDIKLDFGGGEGREELRKRLENTDYSLWNELEEILPLGCAVRNDASITMPWYFAQDMGDIDVFETMLVIGENRPVLAAPEEGSAEIAQLSWDVVFRDHSRGPSATHQPIVFGPGRKGYILNEQLRSVIDYRLIAEKGDNGWQITAFLAGD